MTQANVFLICSILALCTGAHAAALPVPPPPVPPDYVQRLPTVSNGSISDESALLTESCEPAALSQPLSYPAGAGGKSGTVVLRVVLNPCGRVRRVRVQTSSGSGHLDQSAMAQALGWVLSLPDGLAPGEGALANLPVEFVYTGEAQSDAITNYDSKLGMMRGVVLSARLQQEICAEAFPESSEANHAAHMAWRERYRTTIDKIENRFQARVSDLAGNDPVRFGEGLQKFAESDAKHRIGLRKLMTSDGKRSFAAGCARLPDLLKSDVMNLEKSFPEQVLVIEAGKPPSDTKP